MLGMVAVIFAWAIGFGYGSWFLLRAIPKEHSWIVRFIFLTGAALAGLASLWLGNCATNALKVNGYI